MRPYDEKLHRGESAPGSLDALVRAGIPRKGCKARAGGYSSCATVWRWTPDIFHWLMSHSTAAYLPPLAQQSLQHYSLATR